MEKDTANKKMFIQIVQQLRSLITEENIQPSDKLPSERVLSERLGVGRSSVREALRSLELLGLIETRRGGGTFLASSPNHRIVEVLATFIMQEDHSFADVHKTREMHEMEAIRVVCQSDMLRKLPLWDGLFVKLEIEGSVHRETFIREIIIASGNRLSLRIWFQLKAYSGELFKGYSEECEKINLQTLLKAIQMGYEEEALEAYLKWIAQLDGNIWGSF